MKTKKLNKALTFSKSTVTHLNPPEMNEVNGGYWDTNFDTNCLKSWCGCETNFYHCKTDLSFCCPEPVWNS